jgi:amidase
VAPEGLQVASEVAAALQDAADRLTDAGWTVSETECPPLREPAALQATLWLSEYYRTAGQAVADEDDPDASFVYEQMCRRSGAADLDQFMDTLQARVRYCRDWERFLEHYPVLLCPVSAKLPFPDLSDVKSPEAFAEVMEAQLLQIAIPFMGLPGLTVSTRLVGDTPVGVQLVARRYHEATLLAAGEDIEARGVPPSPVDP